MADAKTIIVSGLGRCGTSLVMSMLDRAGVPTVGVSPDFEDVRHNALLESHPDEWMAQARGKAVKLLDPHHFPLPDLSGVAVLFLMRDPKQQAKSQVKLMGSAFSLIARQDNRQAVRALAASNRRDTPVALARLREAGASISAIISFSALINSPVLHTQNICRSLELGTHAEAMAARVDRRTPNCLPYLREALHV